MISNILKLLIAGTILIFVGGCEKDITEKRPLMGTWHFTKWEGPNGSLLEEDMPPILASSGDTMMRTTSVQLVFNGKYYSMEGHTFSWQFEGQYSISNRGRWEFKQRVGLLHGINIINIDPWMEKLFDVLTSAHSYELEGDELIIYDDNQRAFLYKQ